MQRFFGGILVFSFLLCVYCAPAQTNVLTQHNDIGRSGLNANETILTPTNVKSGNFGKLFSVPVDGQVYAQPLYVAKLTVPGQGQHNVVFVATMHDSVYAFDADAAGPPLWQVTLLDPAHGAASGATTDPETDTGCNELSGTEFGITSTPVIDLSNNTLFVVGRTFEKGYPLYRLHALDITTGAEKANSPVVLTAAVAGTGNGSSNGVLTFDPKWENQRAGLLFVNGIVYVAFASYCDLGAFHGWIMAYNGTTMAQTSVFTPTPNGAGSGIWMSGTGLAADVPAGTPFGRMFVATGNGDYNPAQSNYGDDVLRLDLTNGVMKVSDDFTPMNQAALEQSDGDLASGGVMLLPDQPLAGHPHQLLTAGKQGYIYVVDRDSLGGYSSSANNDIESLIPNQIGGVYSVPAYWNSNVYYWGDNDNLSQFGITNGLLNPYKSNLSSENLSFPGSTPAISSNGNTNGIVWAIDASAYATNGNARLLAHDASNVATTLYSSATNATRDIPGPAVHFAVPTITNGKVYVAGYGQLSVYGLITPDFTLAANPPSLSVAVSSSNTTSITASPENGFTGSVSLSASNLPTGLAAQFAATGTAGTSTLTFVAAANATPGVYPVLVTGTSGSLSHSLTINVTITAAVVNPPSFTLSANPPVVTVLQGQSVNTTVTVSPMNGFTGAVSLSVASLPTGLSVSDNPDPFTTSTTGTVTAAATATPGDYTLVVTGTSGTLTSSFNFYVTVAPASSGSFTLSANPNALTVAPGQSATSLITLTPLNGFNSPVNLSVSGLPPGATAAFGPGNSATTETLLINTDATATPAGTYPLTVLGSGGGITASTNITLTVAAPSVPIAVNLSSVATIYPITNNGTEAPAGGFDGASYAYSSSLIGTSLTWSGVPFEIGAADQPSATAASTIPLPPGNFATFNFLGAGVFGNHPGQQFIVTYTDGTTSTFFQGMSDWGSPQSYPGESIASAMAYRVTPTGGTQAGPWNLYGYTFALDYTKTVKSITLPNSRNDVLVAATLVPAVDFSISVSPASLQIQQGASAASTISLTQYNGFSGPIMLAVSNLPTGVSATIEPGATPSSATVQFAVSGTTAPGTYTATITGTSGQLNHSVNIALVITSPPDFVLTTGSAITAQVGQQSLSSVKVGDISGFSGTVTFGITGLPSGVTAVFSPAASATGATLILTIASKTVPGTYGLTVTGVSGALSHTAPLSLTVLPLPVTTEVNLSSVFNVSGIGSFGRPVPNGGLDTSSYAYASNLLGKSLRWSDIPFELGKSDALDAVSNAVVPLPPGGFSHLNFLGTGVYGNQVNQTFVVTYTDGTSTSFTQSLSDWGLVKPYAGQSVVSTMPFRVTPKGGTEYGPWHLYHYSLAIDKRKVVKSLTLPHTRNVVVLAVTLTP